MINHAKSYIDRLRSLGLRPTKQRLTICKVLFDGKQTFHFTIDKLKKKLKKILKVRFHWLPFIILCTLLKIMVI